MSDMFKKRLGLDHMIFKVLFNLKFPSSKTTNSVNSLCFLIKNTSSYLKAKQNIKM